jgi:hypothetical protein
MEVMRVNGVADIEHGVRPDSIAVTLLARERDRRDALVSDDMDSFSDLLAEDLVHVHTTGKVNNKAELVEHAGGFLQFIDIVRGPLNVRLLAPGVAIMTGPMTNVVRKRGQEERVSINAFVTQVWVLRGARWQIASFHAVRTEAPA